MSVIQQRAKCTRSDMQERRYSVGCRTGDILSPVHWLLMVRANTFRPTTRKFFSPNEARIVAPQEMLVWTTFSMDTGIA